jgi:hypothetical protein
MCQYIHNEINVVVVVITIEGKRLATSSLYASLGYHFLHLNLSIIYRRTIPWDRWICLSAQALIEAMERKALDLT